MAFPQWYAGEVITADRLNGPRTQLVMQENDQTVTNSTAFVDSEISFLPESNAVYAYWLYLSYSAYGGTGTTSGDFKWAWPPEATVGTLFAAFSQAYALGAGVGFNTGSDIIMRRPGNSTTRVAGGASDASNDVVLSAYESGTFATDSAPSQITMQFGQNSSAPNPTILRGGNQTRLLYQRIA